MLGQDFERHSGPPASWFLALFGHPAPPAFSPDCWVGLEGKVPWSGKNREYLVAVNSEDHDTEIRCDKVCNSAKNLRHISLSQVYLCA